MFRWDKCEGKYKKKEIEAYWEEMKPTKRKGKKEAEEPAPKAKAKAKAKEPAPKAKAKAKVKAKERRRAAFEAAGGAARVKESVATRAQAEHRAQKNDLD